MLLCPFLGMFLLWPRLAWWGWWLSVTCSHGAVPVPLSRCLDLWVTPLTAAAFPGPQILWALQPGGSFAPSAKMQQQPMGTHPRFGGGCSRPWVWGTSVGVLPSCPPRNGARRAISRDSGSIPGTWWPTVPPMQGDWGQVSLACRCFCLEFVPGMSYVSPWTCRLHLDTFSSPGLKPTRKTHRFPPLWKAPEQGHGANCRGYLPWLIAPPSLLPPVLGDTSGMAHLEFSSGESLVSGGKGRGFSAAEGCCDSWG